MEDDKAKSRITTLELRTAAFGLFKDLLRGIAWDTELEKRGAQQCWLICTPLKALCVLLLGRKAGLNKEGASTEKDAGLGGVNPLFLSSHRSRQKPREALVRHSQGNLISWCVHVVFMECQGKLEELKHEKPFKTQGLLSPLAKLALIRCWLHFTS